MRDNFQLTIFKKLLLSIPHLLLMVAVNEVLIFCYDFLYGSFFTDTCRSRAVFV